MKDIVSKRVSHGWGLAARYNSIRISLQLGMIFGTIHNEHTGHSYLSF